ncbi:tetratricopeptide repeat protein [uncultured Lacinutrix sp.]|uniref:tetratricopeptide repeat protein n=1 Tax=uncultured Lacinutrix sp. TaxID=574032 RepID=UPI0026127C09|nr:tetratricopeptide repeat protein [uncultured Lacinutrix sp.]
MSIKKYVLLFFMIPFSLSSQNKQKVDSLKKLLTQDISLKQKIHVYRGLCYQYNYYDKEKAKRYLDSLNAVAKRYKDSTKYKGLVLKHKGMYYNSISDYITAEKEYEKAISHFEIIKDTRYKYRTLLALSDVKRKLGKYEDAIDVIMQSINEKEALGKKEIELVREYEKLGKIYGNIDNINKSNFYLKKTEKAYRDNKKYKALMITLVNLGVNATHQESLKYFKEAKTYAFKYEDYITLAMIYNNTGAIYQSLNNIDSSKYNYNKSLKLSEKYNYPKLKALSTNNLAELCNLENKPKEAIQYLNASLTINQNSSRLPRVAQNYYNLSESYELLKNYKKAFEYRDLHFKLYDSINKQNNIEKINQLEIQYQTAKKEAALALQKEEIKTLNEKSKSDSLTKTLYGIGMFSFLSIATLLYFAFKQRIKKNKIAREKQEEIYKQEIAFKKKELASQTLHLVQKSTFIQELKSNLEKIKQSPDLFKIEFKRLIMLLKKENAEDKDWQVFKTYFSEVHNNFDNKIKAIATDVSEKEIRLASFLRMNLSTKEIASMLNVLPDSVLKSKYRLKKKLQLEKEADLTEFLNTL